MKKVSLLHAATLALCVSASAASADPHQWSGGYVGAYAGAGYGNNEAIVGLLGGYNWQQGIFVYGAELDAFTAPQSSRSEIFVNARVGASLGDRILVFAKVGRGSFSGGAQLVGVGFGAEYAVNQNMSVRVDHEWHDEIGSSPFNGPTFTKIGAVWSF